MLACIEDSWTIATFTLLFVEQSNCVILLEFMISQCGGQIFSVKKKMMPARYQATCKSCNYVTLS